MKRVQSAKKVERDNEPKPDAFVSAKNRIPSKSLTAVQEANENDETNISIAPEKKDSNQERAHMIHMFKQIDQAPLNRLGVPKAEISENAIPQLHQYSLLQRFRGNRDLTAFDTAPVVSVEQDGDSDGENNHNQNNLKKPQQDEWKWWHEQDLEAVKRTIVQKKENAQKQVEKDRYLKAVRALISDRASSTSWGGPE